MDFKDSILTLYQKRSLLATQGTVSAEEKKTRPSGGSPSPKTTHGIDNSVKFTYKDALTLNLCNMSLNRLRQTTLGGPIRRTLTIMAGAAAMLATLAATPAQAGKRNDERVSAKTERLLKTQDQSLEKTNEVARKWELEWAEDVTYRPGVEYVLNNIHPALLRNYMDEGVVIPVGDTPNDPLLGKDVLHEMIAGNIEGYGQAIGTRDAVILGFLREFQQNNKRALQEQLGIFTGTLEEAQTELEAEKTKYLAALDAEFQRLIEIHEEQNRVILGARGRETAVRTQTNKIETATNTAARSIELRDLIKQLWESIEQDSPPTKEEAATLYTGDDWESIEQDLPPTKEQAETLYTGDDSDPVRFSPEFIEAVSNIGRVITMLEKVEKILKAIKNTSDSEELATLATQIFTILTEAEWSPDVLNAANGAPTAKLRLLHVQQLLKDLGLQETIASHEYMRKVELFDPETGEPIYEDGSTQEETITDLEGNTILDENGNPKIQIVGTPVYKQLTDENGDPVIDSEGNSLYEWESYETGNLLREIHKMRREQMRPSRQKEVLATLGKTYQASLEEIEGKKWVRMSKPERAALDRLEDDIKYTQYILTAYEGLLDREQAAGIYTGSETQRSSMPGKLGRDFDDTGSILGEGDMQTVGVTGGTSTVYLRSDDIFTKYDRSGDPLGQMAKYPLIEALGEYTGRVLLATTSEEVLSWSATEGGKLEKENVSPWLGNDTFDHASRRVDEAFERDTIIIPTDLMGATLLTNDTALTRPPEGTAGFVGGLYGQLGLNMEPAARTIGQIAIKQALGHLAVSLGRHPGLGAKLACGDVLLQTVVGPQRTTNTQSMWVGSSSLSNPTVAGITGATCEQIDLALDNNTVDGIDASDRTVNALLLLVDAQKGEPRGILGLPRTDENTVRLTGVRDVITTLAGTSVAGPYTPKWTTGVGLWTNDFNSAERAAKQQERAAKQQARAAKRKARKEKE